MFQLLILGGTLHVLYHSLCSSY